MEAGVDQESEDNCRWGQGEDEVGGGSGKSWKDGGERRDDGRSWCTWFYILTRNGHSFFVDNDVSQKGLIIFVLARDLRRLAKLRVIIGYHYTFLYKINAANAKIIRRGRKAVM